MHGHSGTFIPVPYIDQHGEVDLGFRRGRPMTLCPRRVEALTRLWLAHDIASLVARKVEARHDFGGWETM
jgi:hypothetical protein